MRRVKVTKKPLISNSKTVDAGRKVPREEANLEVENGEQAIGDINNDGFIEFIDYKGKKHSEGGIAINIPDGTFVFSNTPKMKIKDKKILKDMFGTTAKNGITPAQLSKKFPLNDYVNILKDVDSSDLEKHTAKLMLDKNIKKLGGIALMQENQKGFPDGIPDIAQIAMADMGISQEELFPQQLQLGQEQGVPTQEAKFGGSHMSDGSGYCDKNTLSKFCKSGIKKAQDGYFKRLTKDNIFDEEFGEQLKNQFGNDNEEAYDLLVEAERANPGIIDKFHNAYFSDNENIRQSAINDLDATDISGFSWMPWSDQDELDDFQDILRNNTKQKNKDYQKRISDYKDNLIKMKKQLSEKVNNFDKATNSLSTLHDYENQIKKIDVILNKQSNKNGLYEWEKSPYSQMFLKPNLRDNSPNVGNIIEYGKSMGINPDMKIERKAESSFEKTKPETTNGNQEVVKEVSGQEEFDNQIIDISDTTKYKPIEFKTGGVKLPKAQTGKNKKSNVTLVTDNNGNYIVTVYDENGSIHSQTKSKDKDKAISMAKSYRTRIENNNKNNSTSSTNTKSKSHDVTYDTEDKELTELLKKNGIKLTYLPDDYRYQDSSIGSQHEFDEESGFWYDSSKSKKPGSEGLEEYIKIHKEPIEQYDADNGKGAWKKNFLESKGKESKAMRYLVDYENEKFEAATKSGKQLIDTSVRGAYIPGVELFNMPTVENSIEPTEYKGENKTEKEVTNGDNFKCPEGTTKNPETGECESNFNQLVQDDNRMWLPDLMTIANAATDKIYHGKGPHLSKYNMSPGDYVLQDPTRALENINEQANIATTGIENSLGGPEATAAILAVQGQAGKQAADTLSRVHNRNNDIVNSYSRYAAGIGNQENTLNENALKRFIDEGEILGQNETTAFNNKKNKVSAAVTNGFKNKIDTELFEARYPQYTANKFTGEMLYRGNNQPILDEDGNIIYDPRRTGADANPSTATINEEAKQYQKLVSEVGEEGAKVIWNNRGKRDINNQRYNPNYYGASYTAPGTGRKRRKH